MRKLIIPILMFILSFSIVYGATCQPSANAVILCENTNCVYNMDQPIKVTLKMNIDNIGQENSPVRFYLHEVGKASECVTQSTNCIRSSTSYSDYVESGTATVTFEALNEYKNTEVTAKLKDNSLVTKGISIRPAIKLTLSYPIENAQGIYVTNQLAKANVEIKDLVTQSIIINPSSFQCKFYKGLIEFSPSDRSCNPTLVSFTPDSTGTYRIWAKAEYNKIDSSTGMLINYFPSESFIDLSVQLPTQEINTYIGGEDIDSLPKIGNSYEIDTKQYTLQIKSSMGNEPYPFSKCNIEITAPDTSKTTFTLDNSGDEKIVTQKCRAGIDDECVYTFNYDFKEQGDQYSLGGFCEKDEFIQTFDANFVTKETIGLCTGIKCYLPFIIGGGVGLLFFIIFIIILVKIRGKRPQTPQGEVP